MVIESLFENISARLKQELWKADKSIYIAMAWFTNVDIFNVIKNKARSGCTIKIIVNDDDINKSTIDFDKFNEDNLEIFKVKSIGNLMHHKFCVIDNKTVISGSYNWSNKADSNFENIIINQNDNVLASQFINEFNNILRKHFPDHTINKADDPFDKIILRMEILKNQILLGDSNELKNNLVIIEEYNKTSNINLDKLIDLIKKKKYTRANIEIQDFISNSRKLVSFNNPIISSLELEIKYLENQLTAFESERIELEKIILEFQNRHAIELGEIILEILKLKKNKHRNNQEKFKQAERDEERYQEQYNFEKKNEIIKLSNEQKSEIKKKFRKATFLCHPDKVNDEFKELAEEYFVKLKSAYDLNDLGRVCEILSELESNNFLKLNSEKITEVDLLNLKTSKLKRQIEHIQNEIISIKKSKTYQIVYQIKDWDEYFQETKLKLKNELDYLNKEISNS
ncbi:phosphodiesterase/nuclease, phospholipase D superfamily protein [Psychroflexus torquis ATCC 700755]|uniref:phospholipase D n=1 Tax=Psychroflexus torquis (strain ATCC 700755 / CIP 106069 / ACAM 623) TaxID=313595 RepID=K4IGQ7_PSYTT|nr:phospholipase D-like domain-containing protein [Psychroflexus torquis]AFU69514.1 phosphodiesterase/nuclease, phospholipase D superfamily protein [Psychroflexus torquis ATCC 700755]